MSFQNRVDAQGNVVVHVKPTFGKIVTVDDIKKQQIVQTVEEARRKFGARTDRPHDFDANRYISINVKEIIEEPVQPEHIHEYVERSRLAYRN